MLAILEFLARSSWAACLVLAVASVPFAVACDGEREGGPWATAQERDLTQPTAAADHFAEAGKKVDPLFFSRANGGCVRVCGEPASVADFVCRYQTALWPDWRRDEKYAARFEADVLNHVRKSGVALIYAGDNQHREAFVQAIR
jgi:hypothetical protein